MKRLVMARESKGWTQTELARRAKLAPATVSRIEAGKIYPGGNTVKALARALRVSVGWLLEEKEVS